MLTDVQKKKPVPCDDTCPSYHLHPQPILVFPQKFSRKAAIRPIVPIDLTSVKYVTFKSHWGCLGPKY